jgi:ubiquinone biosynthesis accessory factor UbiJ
VIAHLQEQLLAGINRQLTANAAAKDRLAAFAGQTATIEMAPFVFVARIGAGGGIAELNVKPGSAPAAVSLADGDVHLVVPMRLLPLLLRGDHTAMREIKIVGSAGFAQTLAEVSQGLQWDFEGELALALGRVAPATVADVGARTLARLGAGGLARMRDIRARASQQVAEFVVHEAQVVAHPIQIEDFAARVDALRMRLDRIGKRVGNLST